MQLTELISFKFLNCGRSVKDSFKKPSLFQFIEKYLFARWTVHFLTTSSAACFGLNMANHF
jgi:hypothetical protein